ncbi:hypothetical protein H0H93_008930 [Arthromyces matolae]|nr:hypothetical protein H0H93_008930 [Arthromyces matolae]
MASQIELDALAANLPNYSESNTSVSSSSQIFGQSNEAAPRYSAIFALHGRPIQGGRSSRPLETEHSFGLQSEGTSWVKLECVSRAASPSKTPKYEEGDSISGALILDLPSATYISSIILSFRGRLITSSSDDGSCTFLEKTHTVWSKAHGNPRHASSTQNLKHKGNLEAGEYTWPFSFPIPSKVDCIDDSGSTRMKTCRTPHSFSEHEMPAMIKYEFMLHIARGALRPDKTLTVPVMYTPKIIADPPSALRQLSYRDAQPLVGPLGDPGGWKTLPSVVAKPKLLETGKAAKVECTLSLANPLCYARGSVLPCRLDLESDDSAILDALSTGDAVRVVLQRRVRYYPKGLRGKPITQTSTAGTAIWWQSLADLRPDDPRVRIMEGEFRLSSRLQPTSNFPLCSIDYMINFFDFLSPVVHPQGGLKLPLLTQEVNIATFAPRGPRAREYSIVMNDSNPQPNTISLRSHDQQQAVFFSDRFPS